MGFSRRRLPHLYDGTHPIFITWRLHGSLPEARVFPSSVTSGQAFTLMDRLLDKAATGPRYLQRPEIAGMVVDAIQYNANSLRHYELHAFVVMSNHAHILVSPSVPLPKLTKSLKNITAKRGNAMLGLTGRPFWQDESYDRLVRNPSEFERIRHYIENNPVKADLVTHSNQFRWSSASHE